MTTDLSRSLGRMDGIRAYQHGEEQNPVDAFDARVSRRPNLSWDVYLDAYVAGFRGVADSVQQQAALAARNEVARRPPAGVTRWTVRL